MRSRGNGLVGKLLALAALCLVAGAACGDDGDDGANESDAGEAAVDTSEEAAQTPEVTTVPACDVVEADAVADLFGGDDATAEPQGNSCTYAVSNGLVDAVALVDPEPASERWLNYKNMLQQSGEELVDVEGVGDEAYTLTPVSREPQLVVRTGTKMFSAGFQGDETPEAMDALEAFAQSVVDNIADEG